MYIYKLHKYLYTIYVLHTYPYMHQPCPRGEAPTGHGQHITLSICHASLSCLWCVLRPIPWGTPALARLGTASYIYKVYRIYKLYIQQQYIYSYILYYSIYDIKLQ